MDFAALIEQAVWVDWKKGAEEALHAIRAGYHAVCPALENAAFGAPAENYAAEDTLDALRAIGQELTQFGCALYHVEEDADAYPLVLLAEEEAADFEAWCKKRRQKPHKLASRGEGPACPPGGWIWGSGFPARVMKCPKAGGSGGIGIDRRTTPSG